MWKRSYHKDYQGISAASVWQLWADVDNWPQWHGDLESCKLEGPFEAGSHFCLKPKGMRAVKIRLTDVQPGKEFTDCTHFPGAKMWDTHRIEATPTGLRLHNQLVVTGPLRWLWVKLVAKKVAQSVPEELDALVDLTRKEAAS